MYHRNQMSVTLNDTSFDLRVIPAVENVGKLYSKTCIVYCCECDYDTVFTAISELPQVDRVDRIAIRGLVENDPILPPPIPPIPEMTMSRKDKSFMAIAAVITLLIILYVFFMLVNGAKHS